MKTYAMIRLPMMLAMTLAIPFGTLTAVSPEAIDLGTSADFGALAGGAISGSGHVKGDVGSGTGAIAPAITSTATIYSTGDDVVMTALADFAAAYDDGLTRAYDELLSAAAYELGGQTLTPGVYKIGGAATLATPVTFDAQGDPDAVFIIQITGALGATAGVGNVLLTNEAQSAHIFWVVEGAVSMGADTHMAGTILGGADITFGADTSINGRALSGLAAGTIGLAATTISVPVEPSVVGGFVWLDANGDGIQDPAETTGFSNVPVALMQVMGRVDIDLGSAANFGALAGGAISGTGDVEGDVGSGTGAVAAGINSTSGTVYATGDAVVMTALNDFAAAYSDGLSRPYDVRLSAAAYELGGQTLTPGVYKIGAAATVASPVTLDAEGDPDAVFIIQITGALGSTAGVGNVVLTNDAQSANVYWIVEGAVSMGAGTHMEGNLLGGADITFGADTSMSGRALTGSPAGTIGLAATTISAVTGTPPEGNPPPIVAAETTTDTSGTYLFEGVQPGTYLVRWDLTGIPSDFRITTAHQGDDDALDSDGVTGDVGGFVMTMEIEVLGGTTQLNVDLGLVETLPAIQAVAMDDLAAALATYLEANYYSAENWEALKSAKADGDIAIQAATDPEGVAAARDVALAAMAAVPTYAETLLAAQTAALDDLAAAQESYLEADYTAENWEALNNAKTDGDAAIQAASDPASVSAAKDAALAAMDAVPTIVETLAAAKAAALDDLATALAAYLEANYYSAENWEALKTAKTDGDAAIQAATDPEGVTAAKEAALAAMDAVLAIPQKPVITSLSWNSEGGVTLSLTTTPNFLLTLQTSTDLKSWTTIDSATPGTSFWTFVPDPELVTGPIRFYRAFLNP